MPKNIKTIPTSEYDAVISTVEKYVEGLRVGNNEVIAKAFNKEATMYGFTTEGDLLGGPISNLYDYVKQYGDAPKIKTRLDLLAITPSTAVVRVDMEGDAAGTDYTDFHTLIKLDGRWQIIAKTFHAYASSASQDTLD
jgi:Putative lumazine-binding